MKKKQSGELPSDLYYHLYSSTHSTPLFYGTIKTHKENLPIRPIVSFIDSPTYQTAKLLSKILTPISDRAPQKLKNSYKAKEQLSNVRVPATNVLISFDVKSLFTSIPHDLAI